MHAPRMILVRWMVVLSVLWVGGQSAGCDGGGESGSNDVLWTGSSDLSGGPTEDWTGRDAWTSYDAVAYADPGMAADVGMPSDVGADPGSADAPEPPEPEPGQLTAAEWDDNLNFALFVEYLTDLLQSWPSMAFLPVADRVVIQVVGSDDVAVSGARVEVLANGQVVLDAPARPDGRLALFPAREGLEGTGGLSLRVTAPGESPATWEGPLAVEDGQATVGLDAPGQRPGGLDLAFVVDTTGSMTDELSFLKSEIADIVDDLGTAEQQVSLRYALVAYRDFGDDYVTRVFDFTSDLSEFQEDLRGQRADGGGDYEEAVHKALEAMNGLSWRTGNVARVAFHVADAPPHIPDAADFLDQVEAARKRGIGIYPVAASGVADEAEYLMRMAAQSTMARYVFITDDSGIGGGHAEPHIAKDCMQIQFLNALLKRLLRSELAGGYIPPTANEVIREVGAPIDGVCTFEDGTKAYLW